MFKLEGSDVEYLAVPNWAGLKTGSLVSEEIASKCFCTKKSILGDSSAFRIYLLLKIGAKYILG